MGARASLSWGGQAPTTGFRWPQRILRDLATNADDEHPDVSVTHESEWSLGIRRGGRLVYENLDSDDQPRHLTGVPKTEVVRLMRALAEGKLDELESMPWQPGYP